MDGYNPRPVTSEFFPAARERGGVPPVALDPFDRSYGVQYVGSQMQAAVAGEFGHVQLFNPANVQKVVIVEQVRNLEGGNPIYRVARAGVQLTTLGNPGVDAISLRPGSVAQLRAQSSASFLVPPGMGWLASANTTGDMINGRFLVLMPGDDCTVADQTANQLMGLSFRWREVPLEQWR